MRAARHEPTRQTRETPAARASGMCRAPHCAARAWRLCGARLVRLAQALEDQAVEIEIELHVLCSDLVPRREAERALAPQQEPVDDAPQRFVDGELDLLGRGRAARDEQRAEALARPGLLLG